MADDEVLYVGEWLTVRAMRRRNGDMPAKEWVDALSRQGIGQFLAAVRVVENSWRSKRPTAGRTEELEKPINELRVAKKGSSPPHLRLLYVRNGRTMWATHGFTKKRNKVPSSEIATAKAIYAEWRELKERGQ